MAGTPGPRRGESGGRREPPGAAGSRRRRGARGAHSAAPPAGPGQPAAQGSGAALPAAGPPPAPAPAPPPAGMLRPLLLAALCLAGRPDAARGCQLPSEWRPLSEGCRAELAEIIVYARVLALHHEVHGPYNYLPWQYEAGDAGLFYSAEIEMLCDQAWGSMLEVPAGSRLNLTGLGYFSCHSHTVVQDYAYFFFLRMDENYNLLPHGVNFQDAIFPDTQENRRMFSSLFQFSNCSQGQQLATFSSDWEIQEDNRLMCSSVQKALFEEEDHVKKLQQKVATLEKRNKQLRDRVKKVKRSLRQARKNGRHLELVNQKLSEKLAAAAGAIPHINALGQEPPGATYLRG